MSVSEATAFDGNAEHFAQYSEQVRGHVRYEVVHSNLMDYVSGSPMRVVDVGGGSAIDALWLAEMGHDVTVLDPAADQLVIAASRVAEVPSDIGDRIRLVHGTIANLMAGGEGESFDLALSHGVAMYLEKPQGFVIQLSDLVKTGGYVSLLEKSHAGQAARFISQGRWPELTVLQEQGIVLRNNEGRTVHAFKPEDLSGMLKRAKVKPQRRFGVRILSDNLDMPVSALTPEQLKAVVDLEIEQSRNDRTWELGQMLHYIGKKVSAESV